jgi:hypothetical protein
MAELIAINAQALEEVKASNARILEILSRMEPTAPPLFLTRDEFLEKAGIRPTKFAELVRSGRLKVTRHSRKKVFVPITELGRFQRGEL